MRRHLSLLWAVACGLLVSCSTPTAPPSPPMTEASVPRDVHSYANPEAVRVRHVDLDLQVLFDQRQLRGTATLTVEPKANQAGPLQLDTRALTIEKTEASTGGDLFQVVPYTVGQPDRVLGAPLTIQLPAGTQRVRIAYATSPEASGLQWLTPAQTAGRKHPFLFTQSQAIHARSWIPLQDSPAVRVTYTARVRTPAHLLAVMSAENEIDTPRDGDYRFEMRQAIPAYLIALAVGDLEFRPMSPRTGVYAEPPVVAQAAREFDDTEKMMRAVEALYGPYRWGRYDLLVLPPSFPFGGMENPRVTFATPTILAGDKSLVSLVAHELAHSWSGNLVTNATWRDFWLNEGFTVYLEQRIQEAVYGRRRSEMEAVLERQTLEEEMKILPPADEILHINLDGRDPDDNFTQIPYVKGALFLRHLEETFGRERFDAFLRGYFDHFAFQSVTTAQFRAYLQKNLLAQNPQLAAKVPVEEWLTQPGLPASAPRAQSDAFDKVAALGRDWLAGKATLAAMPTRQWTTQEWLHFLSSLPSPLEPARMRELDAAFALTRTGNSEILQQWLLMAIRSNYEPAYPRLEQFLTGVGRRKFLKPLYEELAKTPAGKERAQSIYAKAKSGYHPIAAATVDTILK